MDKYQILDEYHVYMLNKFDNFCRCSDDFESCKAILFEIYGATDIVERLLERCE